MKKSKKEHELAVLINIINDKLKIYEKEKRSYECMIENAPVSVQEKMKFVVQEYEKLIEIEKNKRENLLKKLEATPEIRAYFIKKLKWTFSEWEKPFAGPIKEK